MTKNRKSSENPGKNPETPTNRESENPSRHPSGNPPRNPGHPEENPSGNPADPEENPPRNPEANPSGNPAGQGPRVFISFLGAGKYEPCRYGRPDTGRVLDRETPYVQVAEQDLYGPFEQVHILLTDKSRATHGAALRQEFQNHGHPDPAFTEIPENLDPREQIQTLESIFNCIPEGARVTFDMTHGFRAVPIMMSVAIAFFQASGRAHVEHVLYGAYEQNLDAPGGAGQYAPVHDMVAFYQLADLVDGVARLVELGDARKLAEYVRRPHALIKFPNVAEAFEAVTDVLRNADMIRMQEYVRMALEKLDHAPSSSPSSRPSPIAAYLVEKVRRHFEPLLEHPLSGVYDLNFFRTMHAYVRMLLQHRLYMQAFTVLNETLASFGVFASGPAPTLKPKDWRDFRAHHADAFLSFLNYLSSQKKESENNDKSTKYGDNKVTNENDLFPIIICRYFFPFFPLPRLIINTMIHALWLMSYKMRKEALLLESKIKMEQFQRLWQIFQFLEIDGFLKTAHKRLSNIRNGFDHAWTGCAKGIRSTQQRASSGLNVPPDFSAIGEELNDLLLQAAEKYFRHTGTPTVRGRISAGPSIAGGRKIF